MFAHSFKNTLKMLIRQRPLIFWGLIFPIVLGFLFKLALGNLDDEFALEPIEVAVNEKLFDEPFFNSFMKSLEEENVFVVTKTSNNQKLIDQEVVAYISDVDKLETQGEGLQQTVVETIMNSYLHNMESIKKIMSENPQADLSALMSFSEYVIDDSNQNMNLTNTYFYTLIGMQAMYGYMWGMSVIYQYEANLSTTAKRNTISPMKKWTSLSASLLVAWLINMLIIIITMLVVHFVLKVNIGDRLIPIFGLVSLGALTGVSFGTLIGVSNRKSLDTKIGIGISLTMMMSFLAGMMVSNIKILIEKSAPLINRLNPVALITDALYSLYYYPSLDRYWMNMMWLFMVTVILILLTFKFIRGKQYDSL